MVPQSSPVSSGIALNGSGMPSSGLVHFFDAENINGTNNSGIADGNEVNTWNNLGTSGIAITAAVVAGATFRAAGINSRPSLEFDGMTERYLSTSGAPKLDIDFIHNTGVFDFFIVAKFDTAKASVIFSNTNTAGARGFFAATKAANNFEAYVFNAAAGNPMASVAAGGSYAATTPMLLRISGDGPGASNFQLKSSGTAAATDTIDAPSVGAATNNASCLGASHTGVSSFVDGHIGIMAIYDKKLSAAELAIVHALALSRYGVNP